MKTYAHGVALLNEQAEIIKNAGIKQGLLRKEMVDTFCPVKIGDDVVSNHGGRNVGKLMRVLAICPAVGVVSSGFIATGYLVRDDGSVRHAVGEKWVDPC